MIRSNKKKVKISIIILLFLSPFLYNCTNESTTNFGIFIKNKHNSLVGYDGCTPIQFDKKTVLWTFGDTILGKWNKSISVNTTFEESAEMNFMVSSSAAFTASPDENNIKTLKFHFLTEKNKVKELLPLTRTERLKKVRLWPLDGVRINNRLFLFFIKVRININQSALPFSIIGTGIAEWKIPPNWKRGDKVDFKRKNLIFTSKEPIFGDAVIIKDHFLYIVGRKKFKNKINAYIAKVHPKNILKRNKYRFQSCKGSWEKSIIEACPNLGDVSGELSLAYNSYLRKYTIVYCSLQGQIRGLTFENFALLHKTTSKILYNPEPLPSIKNRKLLFYYSGKEIFNTPTHVYAIYINPAIYQPILIKIPNKMLLGEK